MSGTKECPICKMEAAYSPDFGRSLVFFDCPVCGRFELWRNAEANKFNYNHLSSYLVYNCFSGSDYGEYRYHTVMDKEKCDHYRQEFDKGHNTIGRPVHIDSDMVENWYPKTFTEKVDYILLYINSKTEHFGQRFSMSFQEMIAVLFIDQHELDTTYGDNRWIWRSQDDCDNEARFMLNYLTSNNLVSFEEGSCEEDWIEIGLMPDGYSRVDVLQKNTAYGRNVLVAMKFGDDTKLLREAIRKGITQAGYVAIFIDEVQHNDFITPELLKHIRDSKFVVVDLTHQNNGAYFEEGYAMGLGKPVIQLCQKSTKLHFDIAQKNTIMWENEESISEMLTNRIKATIE